MYTQWCDLRILYWLGHYIRYVIPMHIPIDLWKMQSSTSTTQFRVTISRADWNGFDICSGESRMLTINAADPSSMFCEGCKANDVKTYRLSSELPQFAPIGFPYNHLLELPGNLSTSEVGTDDAYVHSCSKLSLRRLQRLRTSVCMVRMARGNIPIRGSRCENMYRIGGKGR